jgi:hypothetical protein
VGDESIITVACGDLAGGIFFHLLHLCIAAVPHPKDVLSTINHTAARRQIHFMLPSATLFYPEPEREAETLENSCVELALIFRPCRCVMAKRLCDIWQCLIWPERGSPSRSTFATSTVIGKSRHNRPVEAAAGQETRAPKASKL